MQPHPTMEQIPSEAEQPTPIPSRRGEWFRPLLIGFVGAALALAVFTFGFLAGQESSGSSGVPSYITVQHQGIPSSKVDCLDWASRNFDNVTTGLLNMVCGGQ